MAFDKHKLDQMIESGAVDWHKCAGKFEPLRIRGHFRSPIVADEWLPIDGLVLYQAHRYQAGDGPAVTVPGGRNTNSVSRLPLATVRFGRKDWYYKASWAQWPDHVVEGYDHWNKRFDSQFAYMLDLGRRKQVTIKSGEFKNYHMPIFYRAALWADWYVVGCCESLELLLPIVTHIGKKGSQGWGRVIRWEIEPWPEDRSVWCDGRLMRGVPQKDALALAGNAKKFERFNVTNYGIRPSYYRRNNQMTLAVPT